MKNGDIYKGKVLAKELNRFIQVEFSDGNQKRLLWDEIENIKKEDGEFVPAKTYLKPISDGSGLITTGWTIFSVTYAATVVACLAECKINNYSYIPLIGPFIQAANLSKYNSWVGPNIASSVIQFTGLILATVGYNKRSAFRKANESLGAFQLTPVLNNEVYGLELKTFF